MSNLPCPFYAARGYHDDTAARVGTHLAWQCTVCERVDVTDTDLAAPDAVPTQPLRGYRATAEEAADYARGHADAAHGGTLDTDCERCVTLAADCGVDLTRRA